MSSTWMVGRRAVPVALASLMFIGVFLSATDALAKRPVLCPEGNFLVEAGALMDTSGTASGLELVALTANPDGTSTISISNGTISCPGTRARLRGRRDGSTRVKAVWRTGTCAPLEGKARLKATINNECLGMDGLIRVARSSLKKRLFQASADLLKPFRSVQEIFTGSCALGLCHSTFARKGGLILDSEETSYGSLVDQPADLPEAQAMGLLRVKSGDPENSFLIRKLRGLGPGTPMPQVGQQLPEPAIQMIEDWILRGAHTTVEECPAIDEVTSGRATVGRHGSGGDPTVCDLGPVDPGDFEWEPEPPLEVPAPNEGIQLYVPKRDVDAGTEWETCYVFHPDWDQIAADVGVAGPIQVFVKQQIYRMHSGSHHLLLYAYSGDDPNGWAEGFFPCTAAQCVNPGDCPSDTGQNLLPIGGTQVAGVRYEVTYPPGVGLPMNLLSGGDTVLIANLHYTNPFQPPQPIYGEAWLNLIFQPPGEFTTLLDGIFAINYRDLIVEPYETRTISDIWQPRSILTGLPEDASVFQLFGHMHLRGESFKIDFLTGGSCSVSGDLCGRDDDCACRPWQSSCQPGQTCQLDPDAEDTTIYFTTQWDNAPVVDYPSPYFPVDKDQGLRWTCQHTNGDIDDPTRPPKKCHQDCEACGWDASSRTCIFTRGVSLGVDSSPRVYNEGDPMPLVFGQLADDDMCNMFGYFVRQGSVP